MDAESQHRNVICSQLWKKKIQWAMETENAGIVRIIPFAVMALESAQVQLVIHETSYLFT